MRKTVLAAAMLTATTASAQEMSAFGDLWMACDLAQLDAGADAPMPDRLESIRILERPGEKPTLRILASTYSGEAMFCEMEVDVTAFRINDQNLLD